VIKKFSFIRDTTKWYVVFRGVFNVLAFVLGCIATEPVKAQRIPRIQFPPVDTVLKKEYLEVATRMVKQMNAGSKDSALQICNRYHQRSVQKGDSSMQYYSNACYSLYYFALSQYDQVLNYALEAKKYARNFAGYSQKAFIGEMIAKALINTGQLDQAFPYVKAALDDCYRTGDDNNTGPCLQTFSIYYNNQGDLLKSIEYTNLAIDHSNRMPDAGRKSLQFASMYTSIAQKYLMLKYYEKSLKYCLMGYSIRKEKKESGGMIINCHILGMNLKLNAEERIGYLKEGLECCSLSGNHEYEQKFLYDLASIYYDLNQTDSSLYYFQKAKNHTYTITESAAKKFTEDAAFAITLKLKPEEAGRWVDLYTQQRNPEEKNLQQWASILYKRKFLYFEASKQYDSAFYYLQLYQTISDSMQGKEMLRMTERMNFEFDAERKEKQIEFLNQKNEIQQLEITNNQIKIRQQELENLKQRQAFIIQQLELKDKSTSLALSEALRQKQMQDLKLVNQEISLKETELKYLKGEQLNRELIIKRKLALERNRQAIKNKNILIGTGSALSLMMIGFIVIRSRQRRKFQREQFALMLKVQEEERGRIASEMHDDLGTGLTSIKMLTELAQYKTERGVPGDELSKINRNVNQMIETMSDIVWALNPQQDSLPNLMLYIKTYCTDYLNEHQISVSFQFNVPERIAEIKGSTRRNILLVVKECLHNIVKHAHATEVDITASIQQGQLVMILEDNGKGFKEEQVRFFANGLKNMRARMEAVQGSLDIISSKGTRIVISLPVMDHTNVVYAN